MPNNALRDLPEVQKKEQTLSKAVSFSKKVVSLVQNIGELVSLQILDLRCNDIQEIPVSIGQLTNLRVLDLRINDIHVVCICVQFSCFPPLQS